MVELADLSREVRGGEDVGGGRVVGCWGGGGGGGGGGLFRHFSFFFFFFKNYFCFYWKKGKGGTCSEKNKERANSWDASLLNGKKCDQSCFFLFELFKIFHCDICIRIRGERKGCQSRKEKKMVVIVFQHGTI